MFTTKFWRQATERAAKTAAQALILFWSADQLDVLHTDWKLAGGLAAGAAVLSVLTSVASTPFGEGDSPSVVSTR